MMLHVYNDGCYSGVTCAYTRPGDGAVKCGNPAELHVVTDAVPLFFPPSKLVHICSECFLSLLAPAFTFNASAERVERDRAQRERKERASKRRKK